jgi:hypothetical protein
VKKNTKPLLIGAVLGFALGMAFAGGGKKRQKRTPRGGN